METFGEQVLACRSARLVPVGFRIQRTCREDRAPLTYRHFADDFKANVTPTLRR